MSAKRLDGLAYTTASIRIKEKDPAKAKTLAEGEFLAYAKNVKYPEAEGWHTHQVLSQVVSDSFVLEEAKDIVKGRTPAKKEK